MKTPISLIVDDPAPVISSFYECAVSGTTSYIHAKERQETKDGRPLLKTFSNKFLYQFCDIIEKHGIKGKFTVIPMPGNKGDIVKGLEGVSREELSEWIETAKLRVAKNFTIGPEILTHNKAVDLKTGLSLQLSERDWKGEEYTPPTLEERFLTLIRQVKLMESYKDSHIAILESRKHTAWYMQGLKGAASLRRLCGEINSLKDITDICQKALDMNPNL